MAYACLHAGSSLHVREHLERESRCAALEKKRKTAKSTAAVQGTNAPATSTAPAAPGRHERLLDELKRVDRVLQRGARSILIHALWRESCQVSLQGQDPHPDGICVRFRGEEAFNSADCRTPVRKTFTDLLKRLHAQCGRPAACDRYCTPLAGTLYWQALHHQGSVLQASVTPVMVAAQASRAQLQAVGKCAGALVQRRARAQHVLCSRLAPSRGARARSFVSFVFKPTAVPWCIHTHVRTLLCCLACGHGRSARLRGRVSGYVPLRDTSPAGQRRRFCLCVRRCLRLRNASPKLPPLLSRLLTYIPIMV